MVSSCLILTNLTGFHHCLQWAILKEQFAKEIRIYKSATEDKIVINQLDALNGYPLRLWGRNDTVAWIPWLECLDNIWFGRWFNVSEKILCEFTWVWMLQWHERNSRTLLPLLQDVAIKCCCCMRESIVFTYSMFL